MTSMQTLKDTILFNAYQPDVKEFLTLLNLDMTEDKLSYYELVKASTAWTFFYKSQNLKPGDKVIVILPHSRHLYSSFLGAILGEYVPVMYAFPSMKFSEEEYFKSFVALLKNTKPSYIVTYPELKDKLKCFGDEIPVGTPEDVDVINNGPIEYLQTRGPKDIAFLQYSSGTTGLKKGVAITHGALLWQIKAYADAIKLVNSDIIVNWLPLYHDMGLITCFFLPLLTRTPLVAMSPHDWVKKPELLLQAITKYRTSLCWMPNFAFNFMSSKIPDSRLNGVDLSSLRGLINCAEPIQQESLDAFTNRYAPYGFNASSHKVCYAMAENTFAITSGGFDEPVVFDHIDAKLFVSENLAKCADERVRDVKSIVGSGKALPETQIVIVDKSRIPLPDQFVGEIAINSPSLLEEYYSNPEATFASLADGFYYTGDLGYLSNGELFVTGRAKDIIIIHGINIYPQDVENALNEIEGLLPGRNVVFAIYNKEIGSEEIIVLAESEITSANELKRLESHVLEVVTATTEFTPKDVRILPPRWLIKSSSGKISRNGNRAKYSSYFCNNYTGPISIMVQDEHLTVTEKQVLQCVFEVVSKRHQGRVIDLSVNSSLLKSGLLDSLTLIELIVSIEATCNKQIPPELISRIESWDTARDISILIESVNQNYLCRTISDYLNDLDERQAKCSSIEESDQDFDLLILGTSRTMGLHTSIASKAGYKAFNFSVNNAQTDDWYSMLRFVLDRNRKPLRAVIVGIDVSSFCGTREYRLTECPSLIRYVDSDAVGSGANCNDDRSAQIRFFIERGGVALSKYSFSPSGDMFTRDNESFNQRVPVVLQEKDNRNASEALRFKGKEALDRSSVFYFTLFTELCRKHGIAVYAFLTPQHRCLSDFLRENTTYNLLVEEFKQYLHSVKSSNFVFADLTDVTTFGGLENDFYDAAHIGAVNSDLLMRFALDKIPIQPKLAEKSRFIVSHAGISHAAPHESLFIAEPFVYYDLHAKGQLSRFSHINVAPCIRKSPDDLRAANSLVWTKHHAYLPILAERLNTIHDTTLSEDFWRRALSMGLMRHLTMVYDLFKIAETYFDPEQHAAHVMAPESYYTPINYDEQRWFLQHSNFGQEQLFSLYLRCFYPGLGEEYHSSYVSPYVVPSYSSNTMSDPVVGIMRALFRGTSLYDLSAKSNGTIASIGYSGTFAASEQLSWEKRSKLACSEAWFDRFDQFFFFSLPVLMTREFVEDFHAVFMSLSLQLECYKRLRYAVSETFIGETYESIALAILSLRGVKIVYNEHNYSEYPFYSSILDQQTSFADIFAAHGCYNAPIKHKVSTGSLFEFTCDPGSACETKNHAILYISVICFAKYANYSHSFGETAENAVDYYNFKMSFFESLSTVVLNEMLYRSYPRDRNWQLCYDDNTLMRPFLEQMHCDDHSESGKNRMLQSRLVIVDYLSTSHFESMSMNIPTVILIRPESYVLNEDNNDFFDSLLEVGICQVDPIKAANFIEQVWRNPEEWWMRPEVQTAKNQFLEKNLGKPEYLSDYLLQLSNDSIEYQGDKMKTSINSFIRDRYGVFTSSAKQREFAYSDGEAREERVLTTLLATQDCSIFSDELRKNINDWVTEYHFSQERHNLLRHLKLNKDMRILELGCGCGAITRQFGESGAEVTSVEGSLQRARAAAARCRDLKNVKVYCSNFQDIEFTEKYDLVTFIGVLEYSPQYFESNDPVRECLEIATNALKPDGVLVIAIENQLGLKYFNGLREDHADILYFGIEDRYNAKTAITFGRQQLKRILLEAGLMEVDFHYPFPDYKVPKAVFTEKAFQNNAFYPEEIIRQINSRDYSGELKPAFDEKLAVPVLCRNGIMQDLSHSFLVLASRDASSIDKLYDPNMLATVYTTERASTYNVQTSFLQSGGKDIIARKRRLLSGVSLVSPKDVLTHHPQNEKYIAGLNLEAEYRKCVALRDFEGLSRLLAIQLKFLLTEAVASPDSENPVMAAIKPEYFDCIPSNLILHDDRLDYIDREWNLTKRARLGVLLLRTIDVLHNLENIPELSRDNLLAVLGRLGFDIVPEMVEEYNALIEDVVAQVYRGANLDSATVVREVGIRSRLEGILSKLEYLPKPATVLSRFRSYFEQLFLAQDGIATQFFLDDLSMAGGVGAEDLQLCQTILDTIGNDSKWAPATDFVQSLMKALASRLPLPENPDHNSLITFKKFEYGDEFSSFICPNPFLYAELGLNGEVSCCCYLPFSLGNMNTETINEIWNSDAAQELRRSMLSGEFCYCDKSRCAAMQEAVLPIKKDCFRYQTPYELVRRSQVDNDLLRDALAAGGMVRGAGPEIISFEDDPSCNLSCPSCRRTVSVLTQEQSLERAALDVKLLDAVGPRVRELWFSGAGDPLASKAYREIFKNYDFNRFPQIRFRLDTNGMLFNEHSWNTDLAKIKHRIKLIAVSVDAATEKTYEEIRRGGNFRTLIENLRFIACLPERKRGVAFVIRMIVQQKNYREMKQFVELGRSLAVDGVVFSVMQNWGTFTDQEYQEQAVHLPSHPENKELCSILSDPVFKDPLVNLGNLIELYNRVVVSVNRASGAISVPADGAVRNIAPQSPRRARVIAFYLPQFHPIPENDVWWGKGFTEWTNVGKAVPLFEGHYQPHVPADLGYYDLRVPETRQDQADLARSCGVEAFCYWHYWFAGHQLLERPFNEVLKSGQPDIPFCLGWANQTWSGIWHGAPDRVLIEQTYPGLEDYKAHFDTLLPAFRDPRYLKVHGLPLFVIYAPSSLPDANLFTSYWQELAREAGLGGIYFVAHNVKNPEAYGCQACVDNAPFVSMNAPLEQVTPIGEKAMPKVCGYESLVRYLKQYDLAPGEFPLVVPNWDNTPRSGSNGFVLRGSTPELFREMLEDAVAKVEQYTDPEERIIFVKAWNEWAEGNHLEPDLLYGHQYLDAVMRSVYLSEPHERAGEL